MAYSGGVDGGTPRPLWLFPEGRLIALGLKAGPIGGRFCAVPGLLPGNNFNFLIMMLQQDTHLLGEIMLSSHWEPDCQMAGQSLVQWFTAAHKLQREGQLWIYNVYIVSGRMEGQVAAWTGLPLAVEERDKCAVAVCFRVLHDLLALVDPYSDYGIGSTAHCYLGRSAVSGLNHGGPGIETAVWNVSLRLTDTFHFVLWAPYAGYWWIRYKDISSWTGMFISFRDYNYGSFPIDLEHKWRYLSVHQRPSAHKFIL